MITIDTKLDMFKRMVLDKSKNELESKIHELDQEDERVLSEYREELAIQAKIFYRDTVKRTEIERKRMISKARIEKNKHILITRQEMIREVEEEVFKNSEQMARSEVYEDKMIILFKRLEKELKPFEGIIVQMTAYDYKNNMEIFKRGIRKIGYRGNVEYEVGHDDMIAGFIVYDKQKVYKYDNSFRRIIDNNIEIIGETIFELLDKVGEGLG